MHQPSPIPQVHLRSDEFSDIYESLRHCLNEFCGSAGDQLEGKPLLNEARSRLARTKDARLRHDFANGFIPLFERLHACKRGHEATPAELEVRFDA